MKVMGFLFLWFAFLEVKNEICSKNSGTWQLLSLIQYRVLSYVPTIGNFYQIMLSIIALYQQLELTEASSWAAQALLSFHHCTKHVLPPPPAKLGMVPIRASTLAFSICVLFTPSPHGYIASPSTDYQTLLLAARLFCLWYCYRVKTRRENWNQKKSQNRLC